MGPMIYGNGLDERVAWAAGVFRSTSDDYGDDVSFGGGYAGTFHSTFLAWHEEMDEYTRRLLHLGGSFSYRTPGDEPVRYSSEPSAPACASKALAVFLSLSTPEIRGCLRRSGWWLEMAWVEGPYSIQGS